MSEAPTLAEVLAEARGNRRWQGHRLTIAKFVAGVGVGLALGLGGFHLLRGAPDAVAPKLDMDSRAVLMDDQRVTGG